MKETDVRPALGSRDKEFSLLRNDRDPHDGRILWIMSSSAVIHHPEIDGWTRKAA